jgi:hypothetical protein
MSSRSSISQAGMPSAPSPTALRVCAYAVEVALVMEGVDNVSLLESYSGALLDEDTRSSPMSRARAQ